MMVVPFSSGPWEAAKACFFPVQLWFGLVERAGQGQARPGKARQGRARRGKASPCRANGFLLRGV